MKQIFIFIFLAVTIIACSKGKVESVPHVSIKSFNTDIVPVNGTLVADLNFTDKEGDLDSVFMIRIRTNAKGRNYKQIPFAVPTFSGHNQGDISVLMDYINVLTLALTEIRVPGSNPSRNEPDTLQLKFRLKDKAGHYSDSTAPKQVIVIR